MTTDVATNGHKGRTVPLPSFTFPDSGITVGLPRFAPDTQAKINQAVQSDPEWCAAHPKPDPPLQKVTNLEGKEEEIPNPDEPTYKQALASYLEALYNEVGERMTALAIRRMVVEVDEDAVTALQDDMAAIGAPFPDDADPREIYIKQICISSLFDLASMMDYVTAHSGPTEAALRRYKAQFQG